MNKKRRILKAIEGLPEVNRVSETGGVPLGDEYMIQVAVYFDDEGAHVPEALGIQASDGVGTKEKLG